MNGNIQSVWYYSLRMAIEIINYFMVDQSGISFRSIPKTALPRKYINTEMMMTAKIFNAKPVRIICDILIFFVAKTKALGGAAIGSIKPIEAPNVAGIIKKSGLMWSEIASPAKTGKKVSTTAVLEAISPKKVMNKTMTTIIRNG